MSVAKLMYIWSAWAIFRFRKAILSRRPFTMAFSLSRSNSNTPPALLQPGSLVLQKLRELFPAHCLAQPVPGRVQVPVRLSLPQETEGTPQTSHTSLPYSPPVICLQLHSLPVSWARPSSHFPCKKLVPLLRASPRSGNTLIMATRSTSPAHGAAANARKAAL